MVVGHLSYQWALTHRLFLLLLLFAYLLVLLKLQNWRNVHPLLVVARQLGPPFRRLKVDKRAWRGVHVLHDALPARRQLGLQLGHVMDIPPVGNYRYTLRKLAGS